jgi:hypothetical protein
MLSDAQPKLVSEMLSNIGLVFFGSLVVPIFAQAQVSVGLMLVGLVLSLAFWAASVYVMTCAKTHV